MKKWPYVVVVILLIFAGYLILSNGYENILPSTSDSASPLKGGTIIIGVSNDVDSFNPLFGESTLAQETTHLILLGLADLNDKSEFEPEIAKSWESSEDHLKLTYYLRKEAVWSDGIPITAEDVKFTFDLLMDTTVASPRQGVTEYIKKVIVEDQHTVTFEFSEAYPAQIFDTAGEILPKHILENVDRSTLRSHEFGRNPIASGPYKLSKWVSQQYIELVPNEKYYGQAPHLDRIVFKIVPDKSNLLMQLRTGEIDMMTNIPPAEIEKLQRENENLSMYQVDGRVYYFIGYNGVNKLFSNKKIRQALTMALDRDKIIEAVLYGYGKPCIGPLPPMIKWAYNNEVEEIPFDPQAAKEILATQGWSDDDGDGYIDKDGQNFEFTLITGAGNQIKSDVAVISQEQLRKIGVKVNIQTLEWTNFIKQIQNKDFEACINGWSSSYYIDPTPIFHSTATNMFNFVSYANPAVDKLIEEGREEMDRQKSSKTWREFQQLVYQDQPYTFLFWIDKAIAVSNRFKNVTPIALSSVYNLEKWYLEE
jgi:peptide/nickel transport system substrate-binding protein